MKIKSLILALAIVSVLAPVAVTAAEMKAADLPAMMSAKQPMQQDFKGPEELLNAAKRGDTAAQLEIAILYEYGFNMPDNEVYALAWYILAADGSAKAVAHRDRLMAKLSAQQVERAKIMSKTLVTGAPMPAPESAPPAPMEQPAPTEAPPTEIAPIPEN